MANHEHIVTKEKQIREQVEVTEKVKAGGPIGELVLTRLEVPQIFPLPSKWRYSVTVDIPTNGDTHCLLYPKCDVLDVSNSIVDTPTLSNSGGTTWTTGSHEINSRPDKAKVIAKFTTPEQEKMGNFT